LFWPWIMELLFLLSGVGTWYALRSRSAGQYLWERTKRLLIPLYTAGLFIVNPPQVYIEAITNDSYRGTFWEGLPIYLTQWKVHLGSPHGLVPVPNSLLHLQDPLSLSHTQGKAQTTRMALR